MSEGVIWNGNPTAVQEYETRAWLEYRKFPGIPIKLSGRYPRLYNLSCGTCGTGTLMLGVLIIGDDEIERCDECERFGSDLAAAAALAESFGNSDIVVMYIPQQKEEPMAVLIDRSHAIYPLSDEAVLIAALAPVSGQLAPVSEQGVVTHETQWCGATDDSGARCTREPHPETSPHVAHTQVGDRIVAARIWGLV